MRTKILLNQKGLTLAEMVIVTIIAVFIATTSMTIFLISNETWRQSAVQVKLQRDATHAFERMVKGSRIAGEARVNGIQEASAISIPALSQIDFTSGVDSVTRSFYLNGNEIFYDPNIGTGGDEIVMYDPDPNEAGTVVSTYTTTLTFTQPSANLVQVQAVLRQRVRDNWMHVAFSTNINLRNPS
jgi:Tfp pilus assembly protein PilW